MKRPNRRPTLRARRMDEWRRTDPNSLYASPMTFVPHVNYSWLKSRYPYYVVWNGYSTERYYAGTKEQRAADINRFETLERQLFGHRVALYNKLARS